MLCRNEIVLTKNAGPKVEMEASRTISSVYSASTLLFKLCRSLARREFFLRIRANANILFCLFKFLFCSRQTKHLFRQLFRALEVILVSNFWLFSEISLKNRVSNCRGVRPSSCVCLTLVLVARVTSFPSSRSPCLFYFRC